jgi:hypothetical protein
LPTPALAPIAGMLLLAGCATAGPPGPTVLALPAHGEAFGLFLQHDATCRQYASAQVGGRSPEQAAARRGIGGALLGTGTGAAAGALIGSASGHAGTGAAIGGGAGLLAGTLLGSAGSHRAAAANQNRYDISYTQCMVANGEQIAPRSPPPPMVVYAPPPPPGIVYVPTPVYAPPPPIPR